MGQVPNTAIGAMVAALIAGTISLLGLIISKEQKTSEFRQTWIDALRCDLTAFLTHINAIHDAIQVEYENYATKVRALSPLYINLNSATFSILLRVNPKEKKSRRLLNTMEAFNELTADEQKFNLEAKQPLESEFVVASQDLLKSEWRRVKSGELTFKIAKFLALLVVLASIVFGCVEGYKTLKETGSASLSTAASQPQLTATVTTAHGGTLGNSNTATETK